jgi:putative ATPase
MAGSFQEHLFDHLAPARKEPLASRLRPQTIDDIVGQTHILGAGRLLRRAILADQISSLIFHGPPGTGKTTLARVIAHHTKGNFMAINAVLSGIATIRESIEEAQRIYRVSQQKSILFVDEVHRFNKTQQDALLPHVENGTIILIGATTENPYFEVNKALVSRSRIFELRSLSEQELYQIADLAVSSPLAYGRRVVTIADDAKGHLVQTCNGDARTLLNAIELAVEPELMNLAQEEPIHIDLSIAEESIQKRAVLYDRDGDAHYDIISAFIKSMRGSDPDAALYWLAKMVHAGEDPKFIFRRMIIAASEDVGLAAPEVLPQVMAAAQAYDYVGMPEGQFHLAQACLALSNAPKSNSALGYFDALGAVKKAHAEKDDVPQHLKDGSRDGDELGHGKGYKYPHAFENHWVAQHYLPEGMRGQLFYHPSSVGDELRVKTETEKRREAAWASFSEPEGLSSAYDHCDNLKQKWEQRSIDDQQKQMTMMRELSFEFAQVKREDLVLDYRSQSGFFALEASRLARSGGVHALCWDEKEADQLRALCAGLDGFSQPFVHAIKGKDYLESKRFESKEPMKPLDDLSELKFDVILLRQSFDDQQDPSELLAALLHRLSAGGRIVSCDYLLREEHRLWQCLEVLRAEPSVVSKFRDLEEGYFASDYFKSRLTSSFFEQESPDFRWVKSEIHPVTFKKKFYRESVLKWFGLESPLGKYLELELSTEEREEMSQLIASALNQRTMQWTRKLHVGVCRWT